MKAFQYLVCVTEKITLTENKQLSVTVFLLPYHPVPVTLLKIDQELEERELIL